MKLTALSRTLLIFSLFLLINNGSACFAEATKESKGKNMQLNLADVELSTLARFVSETTGKNFIFDERLKGKVTVITPSNLSSAESYNLFISVLELKGFTVVPTGFNAFKIIPAAEAKQRGIQLSAQKQVNDTYIARLIPLKYISSEEALKFLQPLISKDGHISTFGPGNLIFIVDSGLNIEKILKILEDIDRQSTREEPEIVFLKFSSADSVAKIVNDGIGRKRLSPQTQAGSEEIKAIADTRLNAVVLFGDKGMRESMKSLITLLDVPSKEAQGRINVFFLENADATEIAKVLEGIIRAGQQKQPGQAGAPMTPFEAAGGISVTADKASNSLVIVASPTDYQNLALVLKQLDKRRRQVYVEAMIAEVSMDKILDVGTKFRGTVLRHGRPVFIGGVGEVNPSTIDNIITGLSGMTAGGLGRYFTIPKDFIPGATSDISAPGLAAIFNLNDFKDVVNVLSTPQLLTSDNKEAEILVGENVPFISKRERDLTTSNTVLNSIERQDVGIKLRITPQITEGDYVKLDIYQEISALQQNESVDVITTVGPSITKRSTKTSVVVKDKQTVVIGGLLQEKTEESVTKVPVLGDIPLLGLLFKNKHSEKTKTNLLVFLTPHVVKDADNLAQITMEKKKESAKMEKAYEEGQLLVKFKGPVAEDKALQIIKDNGASVLKFIEGIKVYHIRLRDGQTVEDALKEFSALPEVEYAEPNFKIKLR